MRKNLITILFLGAFVPLFGQVSKKKAKKKYPKKSVVKKAEVKNTITSDSVIVGKKQPGIEEPKPIEKTEQELALEKVPLVANIIAKKSGYINNRNSVYYKGILAMLKGIYTNNNRIFVYIEIKNSSNIDYEIESAFFNTSPVKRKNEDLELEEKNFLPIWDNKVQIIKKKSTEKLIFAFDKFTLNDEKVLNATFREKDGEREINIVITPSQISKSEYIRL